MLSVLFLCKGQARRWNAYTCSVYLCFCERFHFQLISSPPQIYVLCLICFSVTAIRTIWSIAVLFPPPNYPGSPASFPAHLTPHRLGTPALRPQKILYTCGCFCSLKLAVLLNSCRKWKIIGISRAEEEKEHSSPLIISITTVVICRYGISLKLNAVHSTVNPEYKSSWGEEPFKQVNLHMHLKCD